MDNLTRAIAELEKQALTIQVIQNKTTKYYADGFRRAIFMLKILKGELEMTEKNICKECGEEFLISEGEKLFYDERELAYPKRCKSCRQAKKEKYAARE